MIQYDKLYNDSKNWIIAIDKYEQDYVRKTESVFVLGNGYLGVRSANEETSLKTIRNTFISGTFNKATEAEVTELPNVADIFKLDLLVDGKLLLIHNDNVKKYNKQLNLRTGEMARTLVVDAGNDVELTFEFSRFVSLSDLHVVASNVKITSNKDVNIQFNSGIDATVTNTGAQHFHEGDKRLFDKEVLFQSIKTTESNIEIGIGLTHKFNSEVESLILMERRSIFNRYRKKLIAGEQFEFTKYGIFATSIDLENHNSIQEFVVEESKKVSAISYEQLLAESAAEWKKYWDSVDIKIDGDDFATLSVRYSMFQLRSNAPIHDERMNIGAKGLSGEGYKGHTFWDTELFMLPFFIFTQPQAARSLLKYRYLGLVGAKKKAVENNYEGAMYPWESAWPTDGEVTPVWGAADIVTGLPTKILSGFIEQHITADVVYGVYLYYMVTGDQEFMDKYGYEIIIETAKFWASRVQLNAELDRYEILNVVGPDEYKEEVDNNAFTNTMAKWNMDLALQYIEQLGIEQVSKFISNEQIEKIQKATDKIYVPKPNENGIIPQDDTYLSLKEIDLSAYKKAPVVGTMFEDYSLEQVNQIQVSKQADVLILFLILSDLYSHEILKANWDFYEPRTLHDSSLSLSTHVVLANRLGEDDVVNELFERSCSIDIGQSMTSSDAGIHTASLGGIWQSVVYGFGGIRIENGQLIINPRINKKWNSVDFNFTYKGNKLEIVIDKNNQMEIENTGNEIVEFISKDQKYVVEPNSKITVQ